MRPRRAIVVAWLGIALAMPSVAAAGVVGQVAGVGVTTYTGDDKSDVVSVSLVFVVLGEPPLHRFRATSIFATGECSGQLPPTRADCPSSPRIVFDLKEGNDGANTAALPRTVASTMRGGAGADTLTSSSADDELHGDEGDDVLQPGAGGGTANGGTGDDRFERIEGPVVVSGGAGRDFVQYNAAASTVSLDGLANDSFGSNVQADVEDIDGGAAGDTISGSAGANRLRGMSGDDTLAGGDGNDELDGGTGNDLINAGSGADTVNGGDGDDTIHALDGEADSITCGNGTDAVQADPQDSLALDCDPVACVPTGRDKPANGVDEDCNGRDARIRRNRARITSTWISFPGYTLVTTLRFTGLPRGARIRVSCRGRGCPFKSKRVKVAKRTASATKLFDGARLALGTRVEVRITAPDTMGKIVRYTMRSRKLPAKRKLCDPPGRQKPGRC